MIVRLAALVLLMAALAFASVSPDANVDGRCDSFPCTLTSTLLASDPMVVTTTSNTELANAMLDAPCGATVYLTAGYRWHMTSGQLLTWKTNCPNNNRVNVLSTLDARLPPGQVTKTDEVLMPVLSTLGLASSALGIVVEAKMTGIANPGRGLTIRGIKMESYNAATNGPSLPNRIGNLDYRSWGSKTITLTDSGDHKTFVAQDLNDLPVAWPFSDGSVACAANAHYTSNGVTAKVTVNGVTDIPILADCLAGNSRLLELPPSNGGYNPTWSGTAYSGGDVWGGRTFYPNGLVTFRSALNPGDTVTLTALVSLIRSEADMPGDITVEKCIFEVPRLHHLSVGGGTMLYMAGENIVVKDNAFLGIKATGTGEVKAIAGYYGCYRCTVENNYLEAAGMQFFYGGGQRNLIKTPEDFAVRYNTSVKPTWLRTWYWQPNTYINAGQMVRPLGDTTDTRHFIARNSGLSGAVEPTWQSSTCSAYSGADSRTTDNEVTWGCVSLIENGRYPLKNHFEFKEAVGNIIESNWMQNMYYSDQPCFINNKHESQHTGADLTVKTVNSAIRYNWGNNGYCITAVGTSEFYYFPQGMTVSGRVYDRHGNFGPVRFTNNAFTSMSLNNIAASSSQAKNGICSYLLSFGAQQNTTGFYFEHNLLDNFASDGISHGPSGQTTCQGYTIIPSHRSDTTDLASGPAWFRSNVWGKIPTGLYALQGPTGSTDGLRNVYTYHQSLPTDTLTPWVDPATTPVTAGRVHKNLIFNANSTVFSGDTNNVNRIVASYTSGGFSNYSKKDFVPRTDSTYLKDGHDGRDIGPDFTRIPAIRSSNGVAAPRVQVTGRQVLVTLTLTGGAVESGYPLSLYVSSTQDMMTPISDLNPATYTTPGSSDNDWLVKDGSTRTFVVGKNVPLVDGTYWARITGAGTYAEFSFTIAGDDTSSVSRSASRRLQTTGATQMRVRTNTTYSRAAVNLSGGTTATASCTVGQVCTVPYTVNRGAVTYMQIEELNGSGTVIARVPVAMIAP